MVALTRFSFLVAEAQLRVHRRFQRTARGNARDARGNPVVRRGEHFLGRALDQLLGAQAEDRARGVVAGCDAVFAIERQHAVRHALQHALVVVLHALHVLEQLRVLQADRDLRAEGAQPRLVLPGENAPALVQDLRDSDGAA
jgi:hypothetical protein